MIHLEHSGRNYLADRKKWMDRFWALYDFESEAQEQGLVGDALLSHRRQHQRRVWERMKAELGSIEQRVEQAVSPRAIFGLTIGVKDE